MGFFGKSLKKQLSDHALLFMRDEKKCEFYYKKFKGEKPIDQKEFELFKNHWKAILATIILAIYIRLGSEAKVISTGEYSDIEFDIRGELGSVEVGILLHDYMQSGKDPDAILSEKCFSGGLSSNSRKAVMKAFEEIYKTFEESVRVFI